MNSRLRRYQDALADELERVLPTLGYTRDHKGQWHIDASEWSKESMREFHRIQRDEWRTANYAFLSRAIPTYSSMLANGSDVSPADIDPTMIRCTDIWHKELFRMASLTASARVRAGVGRRVSYIVKDRSNDKLIGIVAIATPTREMRPLNKVLGFDKYDEDELTEAFKTVYNGAILLSVPPYSTLLAGKLVAALMASREACGYLTEAYGSHPAGFTTTSLFGRSSVYNRLKVPDGPCLHKIGFTSGFGNAMITNRMYRLAALVNETNPATHRVGRRFTRMARAFRSIGENPDKILRHHIRREIFWCPTTDNWVDYIARDAPPKIANVLPAGDIAQYWRERWMLPRSKRVTRWQTHRKDDLLDKLVVTPAEDMTNWAIAGGT